MIRSEYQEAYRLYLRALLRFGAKYAVTVKPIGRVKRPTAASLRRLARERERVRAFYKGVRVGMQIAEAARRSGVKPTIPTAEEAKAATATDEEETRAAVELEQIMQLIEEGTVYSGRKATSEAMVHRAADTLEEIFDDAKNRLSAIDIMSRLHTLYGPGMSGLLDMIEKLIYAVYNLHGSGFAAWSGRGARSRWTAELNRIREALA